MTHLTDFFAVRDDNHLLRGDFALMMSFCRLNSRSCMDICSNKQVSRVGR